MNVLILGSNGFIGKQLASSLSERGHNLIGFGRKAISTNSFCSKYIQGEFATYSRFREIFNDFDVDIVYQLISTSIPNSETKLIQQGIEDNVFPTLRLLDAMRLSKKTKTIVFSSSGGTIYGNRLSQIRLSEKDSTNPICSYGVQKLMIENYLRLFSLEHNLKCISARISNPYGIDGAKGDSQGIIPILIRKNINQEEITLFGNTVRDYIHVVDVADCLSRFANLKTESCAINIGSGIGTSLVQLVEMIEFHSGTKFKKIRKLPKRHFDIQYNVLDISKAKKLLDWEPKISLEKGIEELWRLLSSENKHCRSK